MMDKCKNCGAELSPNDRRAPCPKCGSTKRIIDLSVNDGFILSESMGLRQKQKGFKKFKFDLIQGHFNSGDPKLKKGVDIFRTINKEKNEYNQVVKDRETGKIIHEEHEPLTQHRSKKK
ncbi:MAG: hypothetical protein JW845_03775 [Dehalococcoidales bacterium]|nr:hypothetical protein [Dehalococcoidales bacterium]